MNDRNHLRQWINIGSLAAMVLVNIFANVLPINGVTTGEIAGQFDVYFKPAGYAFSIWTIIYLLMIVFVTFQALPAQRANPHLKRIDYLFAFSCLMNIAWIFFWHYQLFTLSLIAMLALLAILVSIYLRLDIGRTRFSVSERIAVSIPFSIYLAWISVATISNVTILLDYFGWNGWGISDQNWAVIMLLVSLVLSSWVAIVRRDVAFLIVFIWALVAITIKQHSIPAISITGSISAAVLGFVAVITAIRYRKWVRGEQVER
ncbi:MAG: tryptophan-rich sensory protein [Bacteroidales bacterium]|nr:tryptophan-rich sensory protein [Bacteroidales bacterium]